MVSFKVYLFNFGQTHTLEFGIDVGQGINVALENFVKMTKVSSSYNLCVECFSQLSFDSEVYTKSATAESCEKHSTQRL